MDEKIKTIKNSKGEEIPIELIGQLELKRHELVEGLHEKIREYEAMGRELSREIDKEISDYLIWLSKITKVRGDVSNKIVSLSLSNYSQTKQIRISSAEGISFDERLQLAKIEIDKCIKKWSEESGENPAIKNIIALVRNAFRVDKKGEINKTELIKLVKTEIDDIDWKKAKTLIMDSMHVVSNKIYKNFNTRAGIKDSWKAINLILSTY